MSGVIKKAKLRWVKGPRGQEKRKGLNGEGDVGHSSDSSGRDDEDAFCIANPFLLFCS